MSNLVTGEAVVLDLQIAKLPSRALGFVIDGTIQFGMFYAMAQLLGGVSGVTDDALTAAVAVAGTLLIFVGLPTSVETITHGRSPGKAAMGLRVVRDDGGMVRFRHALVRALGGFVVDFWLLGWTGIGILTSLASSRGKRVGDYLAGTVVIRERIPTRGGPMAQLPPSLAEWAASLPLSQLPDDLALAARQFISRSAELEPGIRQEMGRRLAAEVASYLGGLPPGVPPETYLSAVLAERRKREVARITGRPSGPSTRPAAAPTPAHGEDPTAQPGAPASGDADPFAPPS